MADSKTRQIGGIITRAADGYNLFIKDNGVDYVELWQDFRAGKLQGLENLKEIEHRSVYRLEADGRSYLVKVDTKCPRPLDLKLWRFIHGPVHSKHMKAVNKAVRKGCRRTQDIFFVAEKNGRICPETFIIIEYLPGRNLDTEADYAPYLADIGAALADLHSHKLSLSDIHAGNFLITDEGIKVIDLSTKGLAWAGIGRDIIEAKQFLGVDVPMGSFSARLSVWYVRGKRAFRDSLRCIRQLFSSKNE